MKPSTTIILYLVILLGIVVLLKALQTQEGLTGSGATTATLPDLYQNLDAAKKDVEKYKEDLKYINGVIRKLTDDTEKRKSTLSNKSTALTKANERYAKNPKSAKDKKEVDRLSKEYGDIFNAQNRDIEALIKQDANKKTAQTGLDNSNSRVKFLNDQIKLLQGQAPPGSSTKNPPAGSSTKNPPAGSSTGNRKAGGNHPVRGGNRQAGAGGKAGGNRQAGAGGKAGGNRQGAGGNRQAGAGGKAGGNRQGAGGNRQAGVNRTENKGIRNAAPNYPNYKFKGCWTVGHDTAYPILNSMVVDNIPNVEQCVKRASELGNATMAYDGKGMCAGGGTEYQSKTSTECYNTYGQGKSWLVYSTV